VHQRCEAPIPGYRVGTSNIVRLSKAEAGESFDFAAFNEGDYNGAVADKWEAVLFRGDELARGKVLRLQRQYFFVSRSLQGMIWANRALNRPVATFREELAVQLNDTIPPSRSPKRCTCSWTNTGWTGIRRGTAASAGCSRTSEARVVVQLSTLIERQGSLYRHCRKQGGNHDDDNWD